MPVNCPQCGQPMSEIDATAAQCAKHGPYTILFKRSAVDDGLIPLAQTAPPVPQAGPSTLPYARGQYSPHAQPALPALPALGPCQNHQQVPAAHRCTRCAARMCNVCDFAFPGEIHLCPRCITSAAGGLSGGRRGMMIAAYAAAGLSTFLIVVFMVAAASGGLTGFNEFLAGIILFFLLACIVTGLGLGVGAIDRQLNNPVSLWIAASWNGVLALGLLLLVVVALIMRHT